jgi:hypothetical protein
VNEGRGLSADDLAWLRLRTPDQPGVGFDADGWAASVWVLHAMWELPGIGELTHDELEREMLADGRLERHLVNGVDLEQLGICTGVCLGMTERMEPPWRRLPWRTLAARLGLDLDSDELARTASWFGYRSWPASIEPPCEGSLDRASFEAIIECLVAVSPLGRRTPCRAFHEPTGWWEQQAVLDARLDRIPTFGSQAQPFTPSNFWPLDRSWFVYTDYDLSATRVSGSADLVAFLRAHPDLEVLDGE